MGNANFTCDGSGVDHALTHQRIGLDEPNIELALAQSEPIQIPDLREETASDINEITLRAGYRARIWWHRCCMGTKLAGLLVVRRRTPAPSHEQRRFDQDIRGAIGAGNPECAIVR